MFSRLLGFPEFQPLAYKRAMQKKRPDGIKLAIYKAIRAPPYHQARRCLHKPVTSLLASDATGALRSCIFFSLRANSPRSG